MNEYIELAYLVGEALGRAGFNHDKPKINMTTRARKPALILSGYLHDVRTWDDAFLGTDLHSDYVGGDGQFSYTLRVWK